LHGLYSFMGGRDAEDPLSGVVAPRQAPPYPQIIGTTAFGGYYNVGTVYGLTKGKKAWTESLLYQFIGSDGWEPMGIAVPKKLDQKSLIFVTSFRGGAHGDGSVTMLEPSPRGTWKRISTYSFSGKPDGAAPQGPVIEEKNGDLYGTTSGGGAYGFGTVYRMQPSGSGYTETILYSFQGGSDGDYPRGGLIAVNAALYGTTEDGGSADSGTVFELTPSGSGYTESVVHSFQGAEDGKQPEAALCAGPDGALYGTTIIGGINSDGTVFKLVPTSSGYTESVLWRFGTSPEDGSNPMGSVIVDKQGVIYGTTVNGGLAFGSGTLFSLTPNGSEYEERLYDFTGTNGAAPETGPSADGKGKLYIATYGGGPHFSGVVAQAEGAAGGSACDPGSITAGA
jgi:uncharacterized repeat protein (TIGR03803 family)